MSAPTILDATANDSLAAGRRRRPRPAAAAVSGGVLPATRKVLIAFAVLTLLAANQLLVVASFTDRYFAWTISVRADLGVPRRRVRRGLPARRARPPAATGGERSGWPWSP